MTARNVTVAELEKALAKANEKYAGNLQFDRFQPNGRSVEFTLRVKSSQAPGHRRTFQGKRMAKACWHAHGDFFDAVLAIHPAARIISRGVGVTITKDGGNWQDKQVGSMMDPRMFSEMCDCH